MADFKGGDVVVVPMPVSPEMVLWALPGPVGDIPYADVENLVDAEFGERIGTMTQLESDTEAHASAAAGSAGAAASSATAADTSASAAASSASTASTRAGEAATYRDAAYTHSQDASTHSTTAGNYAADAETWATSFDLTVGSTTTAAPGSPASVTVTGSGPEHTLSFSIPEGVKGDTGEITQAQLDAAVASLVDNAPEALDTLTELAAALGNDPNFATTVSTEIGKRALIDGAPAAYNTLGKLVAALQNHELGGSTDASLLTGALTDQVDASEATVLIDYGNQGGPETVPVSGALEMAQYMANAAHHVAANHTHDGADITGALTDQVDAGGMLLRVPTGGGSTFDLPLVDGFMALDDRVSDLETNKSDIGHTHPVSGVDGLQTALNGKVTASGAASTLWAGSESAYNDLPEATRNAIGFIAVII